jgi:CHAT domain-containing protein
VRHTPWETKHQCRNQQGHDCTADITYFYTHGGSDAFGKPYLEVGSGDQITFHDFDAWGVNLGHHPPLVVLNACDSADYSPDSFKNLVRFFYGKKAAGVIGTQCEVKENLANAFNLLFFGALFKQASAGQALFETRQKLLKQLDPRGLAYSLFAASDVKLTRPVIV